MRLKEGAFAVRGGFAPSRTLPDFTIQNRETSHVLVKLEQADSGEDHVYFIGPVAEVTPASAWSCRAS